TATTNNNTQIHADDGILALVQNTLHTGAGSNAHLTLDHRHHVEYLPLILSKTTTTTNNDEKTVAPSDKKSIIGTLISASQRNIVKFEIGEKFSLDHVYCKDNRPLVPGIPIRVKSIEAERVYDVTSVTEVIYPYLYSINLEYGTSHEWTVYKRYKQFHKLHKSLVKYIEDQTGESIEDLNELQEGNEDRPCFPTRNDRLAFINEHNIDQRCTGFLEISYLTFVHGLGDSSKESFLLKRLAREEYRGWKLIYHIPFLFDKCKFGRENWFVVKDTYLAYISPNTAAVRWPMLVDSSFQIETDIKHVRTKHGIKIKNSQRPLILKCKNRYQKDEWSDKLEELRLKNEATFCAQNSYGSFVPMRRQQKGHWFINGKDYMEAVAKALLQAKEEIFITDWWLSPELWLVRPSDNPLHRLDNLIGHKANEGVRVYIMLFKEIEKALGINSAYSERILTSKNKNMIKVIRHPDHYLVDGTDNFWSHHEKCVIIDQKLAFVGGVDLCYGRWDDDEMRLVDLGSDNIVELKTAEELEAEDAQKARDESSKGQPSKDTDNLTSDTDANSKTAEIPVPAPQTLLLTKTTKDQSKEQKSNNIIDFDDDDDKKEKKQKKKLKTQRKMMKKAHRQEENPVDENELLIEEEETKVAASGGAARYFIGKDYSNSYEKDFEKLDKYDEDYISRQKEARMPWHDEALVVSGEVARDAARHFIQRWNIHKHQKYLFDDSYPFLLPKTYDNKNELIVDNWKEFLGTEPITINAQFVRSSCLWSAGIKVTEKSIQNAYFTLIDAAKYFIYIENQFFVTIAEHKEVHNLIGDALYRRILRAHTVKEKFRVYVVIPLIPGFNTQNAVDAVIYFTQRSIAKGPNSLYKRLEKQGIKPEEYISFFGMRGHDILMGRLITEIIYIHSKLMIVDDKWAICGSANINDRSMEGCRDSEIAIVIEDEAEMIDTTFNGQSVKVGKFCSNWRKKLFRMMLGILKENPDNISVDDPISDEFYNMFRHIAHQNTLIYENVFLTIPTDRIRNQERDLDNYRFLPKLALKEPLKAYEEVKQIKGLVVDYSIYFKDEDENYLPTITSGGEGWVPNIVWT
ncbi:unnamed protein product, partial [Didymodactylos carnosus]